jgi:hypothetical protein
MPKQDRFVALAFALAMMIHMLYYSIFWSPILVVVNCANVAEVNMPIRSKVNYLLCFKGKSIWYSFTFIIVYLN